MGEAQEAQARGSVACEIASKAALPGHGAQTWRSALGEEDIVAAEVLSIPDEVDEVLDVHEKEEGKVKGKVEGEVSGKVKRKVEFSPRQLQHLDDAEGVVMIDLSPSTQVDDAADAADDEQPPPSQPRDPLWQALDEWADAEEEVMQARESKSST